MSKRAIPVNPGDRQISAGQTINPVVEQANRLADFQGGHGITSQNDPTGFQLSARRRETPDGNSPFGSSSPWRKTMHRRTGSTRHKGEWELWGCNAVSARGASVSSSRPERYGVPFLAVDSDGNGALGWGTFDADEFGSSGPRSIERRSSSSGERFQLFGFDGAASELDSSEVYQVAIRRRFGSSGNHYLAWVGSSVFAAGTFPRWEQVLDAQANVEALSTSDGTRVFFLGKSSRRWSGITAYASNYISFYASSDGGGLTGGWLELYPNNTAGSGYEARLTTLKNMLIESTSGDLDIMVYDGFIRLSARPSTSQGAGVLFTQTATQIAAGGATKVLCIG
jgi:hypothetical protein